MNLFTAKLRFSSPTPLILPETSKINTVRGLKSLELITMD